MEEQHKISTENLSRRILTLEETVIDLTATVRDLTNNEMIRQSQEEEMTEDQEYSIDENDESGDITNESYYVWDDLELKEILKEELCVTNNLKTNINDIMANLKPRIIQETMIKLATLNQNVEHDEIRLKNMERNSKNEHLSEEFYKMIDKFKKMYERLENTSNKKFRKVAEDELKEIYKDILNVQLDKSNNVFGMFDKTIDEEN